MKKKIMITGSCGFLMGNFIRKGIYEELPYSFVSMDRIPKNALNSLYRNKDHLFYPVDIRDSHIVNNLFNYEQPDIVVHGAEDKSPDMLSSNIIGTQNIINACLNSNVSRLIYISSEKVYGSLEENDPLKKEVDIPNPEDIYSISKLTAENLVKVSKLNYNIIRMANSYGPRQNKLKLIPNTINSILQNKPIELYNQGQQLRDWLHLFDSSKAILTVIDKGKPNEMYNVSANQEFSDIEVVQKVCNAMKGGHELISFVPKEVPLRYGIDSSKLRELGWAPELKLKDSVESVKHWFTQNKWWFK